MILDLICQRKVASDKLHRQGNFIKLLQERDRVEFNSTEVKVGRISNWRVGYWKSRWGCYWFTSQIATKSKSDLFWIQESGACSRYPTWSQKYETLGRPLLPSQAFSSELNQKCSNCHLNLYSYGMLGQQLKISFAMLHAGPDLGLFLVSRWKFS